MSKKFPDIQWLVQRNLTNTDDLKQLEDACEKTGVQFTSIDIIPFSPEMTAFDRSRHSIIYGSTTFNSLAYKDIDLRKGIFFDEENFSIENYLNKWGKHMLNYNAEITSFKALISNKSHSADKSLFIRPNDDSKSFAGEVRRFDEIEAWYNKLLLSDHLNLSPESKIVVSKPYNIRYEWRLWIVEKVVVAASKYRKYFKLTKEQGCPAEVISFAEARCMEYTPHDVFVMDICLCGDELYIVECGCMNGAGFYHANIDDIVSNVTDYFQRAIARAV